MPNQRLLVAVLALATLVASQAPVFCDCLETPGEDLCITWTGAGTGENLVCNTKPCSANYICGTPSNEVCVIENPVVTQYHPTVEIVEGPFACFSSTKQIDFLKPVVTSTAGCVLNDAQNPVLEAFCDLQGAPPPGMVSITYTMAINTSLNVVKQGQDPNSCTVNALAVYSSPVPQLTGNPTGTTTLTGMSNGANPAFTVYEETFTVFEGPVFDFLSTAPSFELMVMTELLPLGNFNKNQQEIDVAFSIEYTSLA